MDLSTIKPIYPPTPIPCTPQTTKTEPPTIQSLITTLSLAPHPEGGYFIQTDRHPLRIANPYHYAKVGSINKHNASSNNITTDLKSDTSADADAEKLRAASTSIFYLLTPRSPVGAFHRNRSRTVHTLHRGSGRYVIIHSDEAAREGRKASIETFVVGHRVEIGERLQWIVEGGDYKASFLLPDDEDGEESGGLLISETVVPGFEAADHDFLKPETMDELLTPEQVKDLKWLLRNHEMY